MKKIMKRNKRRRVAQGIGAAAGVAFWTVIIGAIMAGEKKLDEYKTKAVVGMLKAFGVDTKALIVTDGTNDKLVRSAKSRSLSCKVDV